MSAHLIEGKYYIASVDESQIMGLSMYLEYILCIFREEEGLCVVFQDDIQEEIDAMSEHPLEGPCAVIAHDKEVEIKGRHYSGYKHDYSLVEFEKKDEALKKMMRTVQS